MAFKTHKIALNPDTEQRNWFSQQCGYARFAYNAGLSAFKKEPRHWKELNKAFNKAKRDIEWAAGMDQRAAVFGIKNLGDAISRWHSGQNGFPKFKKRGHRQSYSTDPASVSVEKKRIKLPKIGWIRTYESLRFEGKS